MVLQIEQDLLKISNPGYPLHVAKVPPGMGFVDKDPANLFFIRFDEIFNLMHLKRLAPCFIRLVALKMQLDIMAENTKKVAIMDPFYMFESIVSSPMDRVFAIKRIEEFLLANRKKEIFLMPYFAK